MHDAVGYYAVLHTYSSFEFVSFHVGIQFLFGILMKLRKISSVSASLLF